MSSLFDRLRHRYEAGHDGEPPELFGDPRLDGVTDFRPAAVLAALTEREEPGFLLLHRPSNMRAHPGQVALPGGKIDVGETPTEAAVREAWEELGIPPDAVRVIGESDVYKTHSGYEITPVLAVVPPDIEINPNPTEVAQWFEAPAQFVFDPANHVKRHVAWQGTARTYYEIQWREHRIWGVTAALLINLYAGCAGMGDRLPPAAWTQRDDLQTLVAALGPGTTRYVGGAVRDTLLRLEVKDVDLATTLEPRKVMRLLEKSGIKPIPTGIDHGTVTALLPQGSVEITTLRHDVSTDGRRATVAFAQDWREDAARRDFTINALYADPQTLEIADFFGGLADLAARRVRFIGDARQRIREDHLRILRYFRFQARFGSQPADEQAESACAELAPTLMALSRERIGMETMNLLALLDPAPTVARMAELGVLAVILPEAEPEALAALIGEERRQGVAPDPLRRLAALLPADPLLAEQVAARFRLSGAQKKRLALAARRDEKPLPLSFARLRLRGGVGVGVVAETDVDQGRQPPPPTPSPKEEGLRAPVPWLTALVKSRLWIGCF